MRFMKWVGFPLGAFVLLGALPAGAGDKLAAEQLFGDAQKLLLAGNCAEAAKKFEASAKEDRSVGALSGLARSYADCGRPASAWVTYKEAATLANGQGDIRVHEIRKRAAALEPTLSRLTITVTGATPGLVVKRNGSDVSAALLGTAIPVDPGDQVIEAEAPGYKPFKSTVTIGKSNDEQRVEIPALDKDPNWKPPGGGNAGSGGMRIAGFVLIGVGSLGVVGGAIASGLAFADKSTVDACAATGCSAAGLSAWENGRTKETAGGVLLGVGGAIAVTGAILVGVSAPAKSETKARIEVLPGLGSLSIRGRF